MQTLSDSFTAFKTEAFRLEVLPAYSIPSEVDALVAFRQGRVPAVAPDYREWLDLVARTTDGGRRIVRVRIVDVPPTEYQRFELEWAYLLNVDAGESIRYITRQKYEN